MQSHAIIQPHFMPFSQQNARSSSYYMQSQAQSYLIILGVQERHLTQDTPGHADTRVELR